MASQHNYFKEKQLLKEEGKYLKKMMDKFQDQLNRLKVEELALMSKLKMEEQSKGESEAASSSVAEFRSGARSVDQMSDDHISTTSSVVPVGIMYENNPSPEMNYNEVLDLDVHNPTYSQMDPDEEEEEEMGEEAERLYNTHDDLHAFMDSLS